MRSCTYKYWKYICEERWCYTFRQTRLWQFFSLLVYNECYNLNSMYILRHNTDHVYYYWLRTRANQSEWSWTAQITFRCICEWCSFFVRGLCDSFFCCVFVYFWFSCIVSVEEKNAAAMKLTNWDVWLVVKNSENCYSAR